MRAVLSRILALSVLAAGAASAAAVYTTDVTGTVVNGNLYTDKTDVYLTGGPQNCGGGSQLPDGTYYFEVTDPPAQTLLSSDGLGPRTFSVVGGVITGYVPGHIVSGTTACGSQIIQLYPFADTPNNGGVYKMTVGSASCTTVDAGTGLLVSSSSCFKKTDNFKVKNSCTVDCGGVPPSSTISGRKFYDANHDGLEDLSEIGLPNWEIDVTYTDLGVTFTAEAHFTDAGGAWSVIADQGTTITACEVLKPDYKQTFPNAGTPAVSGIAPIGGCWQGTVPANDVNTLDFGNVATGSGTKYYDTNANGVPNGGEPTISGFKVLTCTDANCPSTPTAQYTDVSGNYSFFLPSPTSTFTVCEVLPPPGSVTWSQTGPLNGASPIGNLGAGSATANTVKCWKGSGPTNGMYLTNVCFVTTGALTMGWYKNAGNPTITVSDLTLLVSLNLSNGTGVNTFNPSTVAATGRANVKAWLGNATATNMAYMLSAQLAVMEMNVNHGFISASVLIYAPGTNSANAAGFALLSDVLAEANTLLGSDGIINAADPNRTRAGALETAIDNANNNKNIVGGPGQCAAPTTAY